jgi:UDP-N-acetylmuramoyl-tripeptide--D-alanyl-D-alanine ligase
VLGEMRELGDDSPTLHAAVGRHLAGLGVDHLVVVGNSAAAIVDGARSVAGWSGEAGIVSDSAEAAAAVSAASPADTVLVKASNAFALWRVADLLIADDQVAAGGRA